jgi:two-component system nitrogen regulation response regulator GlnG
VLRAHRWRLKRAAEALGISRPSLYVLIERCPAIRKAGDLEVEEPK